MAQTQGPAGISQPAKVGNASNSYFTTSSSDGKIHLPMISRWVKVAVFRPYASQHWRPRWVLLARRHMCITTSETSWLTQADPRGIHTLSSSVECLIHCPGTACVIIMSHILSHPRNSTWHTIVFFVLSPPCPQFLGRILGTSHTGLTGTGVCTCAGARLSRAALIPVVRPINAGLTWARRQATSGL